METDFKDIEPYADEEVQPALQRVVSNPLFPFLVGKLNPQIDVNEMRQLFLTIQSVEEFQRRVMIPMLLFVAKTTMQHFTYEGLDYLDKSKSYLFVSNHRDITLDAAMLDYMLLRNGLPACEISFGDNLISNPFICDLARINRMFPITRGGSAREMYNASYRVSNYIRHALKEKHRPVWIAQRNGRTKDGDDRTEPGLIKMLSMSHSGDFVSSMSELNIVPIAVSYELEPCVNRKVKETKAIIEKGHYEKGPNEDIQSVLEGVLQPKGDVHFCICKPITVEELEQCVEHHEGNTALNAPYTALAALIDQRIYDGYKLHPNNFEAFDKLRSSSLDFADNTEEELITKLYAKPVENHNHYSSTDLES